MIKNYNDFIDGRLYKVTESVTMPFSNRFGEKPGMERMVELKRGAILKFEKGKLLIYNMFPLDSYYTKEMRELEESFRGFSFDILKDNVKWPINYIDIYISDSEKKRFQELKEKYAGYALQGLLANTNIEWQGDELIRYVAKVATDAADSLAKKITLER